MITSAIPEDWRALQREVGRILTECGFTVEIEKRVEAVRSAVELDVYALEIRDGRAYSIVCECKNWKSRVPQTIVHAFRTVLSDIGANLGYIVSTSGFQDGAFGVSQQTNVRLVTWGEFQSIFERSWVESFFEPILRRISSNCPYRATRVLDEIYHTWLRYVERHDRDCFSVLKQREEEVGDLFSDDDKARFIQLEEQCEAVDWLLSWWRCESTSAQEVLPIDNRIHEYPPRHDVLRHVPVQLLKAKGLREWIEEFTCFSETVYKRFRNFRPSEV